MIRAVLMGKTGPILVLGLTEQNVVRLKAGMPVDVDVDEIMRMLPGHPRVARVVVAHGARHIDVVNDMQAGGLPVPPFLFEQARELDAEVERGKR